MNREILFRRVYRHKTTGQITYANWGVFDNEVGPPLPLRSYDIVRDEQYIGIKDKNGEDIFEGDIVNAYDVYDGMKSSSVTGQIYYHENAFCLLTSNQVFIQFWTSSEEYEVIGTIHDNPELL